MKSLKKLEELKFDTIYLSHSLELKREAIVLEADPKIKAYIKYREERERFVIENLQVIFSNFNITHRDNTR